MKKVKITAIIAVIILITGGLVLSLLLKDNDKDPTKDPENSSTAATGDPSDDQVDDPEDITANDPTDPRDLADYDLKKYTTPFWQGSIVYNEVVYPICDKDGNMGELDLMYEATEIVAVRSYSLTTLYEYGKDYTLVDGKLNISEGGAIEIVPYEYIHAPSAPDGYSSDAFAPYYPRAAGDGYEYWVGSSEICAKALSVTYVHSGKWNGPVPESQESALPKTLEKLKNKKDLVIVATGDSVTTGAMGSGFIGISPFADAYPEMTVKALRQKFGYDNIKLINSAIGGTTSTYDETKLENTVIKYSPDLVIMNFGMNDSSFGRVGISGEEFHDNHVKQINYIKSKLPNCEILLVSSLYGNRYTFPAEKYEEHAGILHTIAEEFSGKGVGVCDPQSIEKYLIETVGKDFLCFMADNMVHPGDFGMRLTAQSILAALDVIDISSYKGRLVGELEAFADSESHTEDGKKDEIDAVLRGVKDAVTDLDDEWDINDLIGAARTEIADIKRRCAFEDHTFEDSVVEPTCKNAGYTLSHCTTCGYDYKHGETEPVGGEHIMDSGIRTLSPTHKAEGVITYTCTKCGYERYTSVPKLTDPAVRGDEKLLHVGDANNYMQCDVQPYLGGTGYVEFDLCPINIDTESMPYAGVWFSGYSITACYNFRLQQVEIIKTGLPYTNSGTPYATASVDWTPDGGEFGCNWKKFAVAIEGNTVKIYLDGELVFEDTNELYGADEEVALIYTIGEYYIDNIRLAGKGYDPETGSGNTLAEWDFDTQKSISNFGASWIVSYATVDYPKTNESNYSTGVYKNHEHTLAYLNTVAAGCSNEGYEEHQCTACGKVIKQNVKVALGNDGHVLCDKNEIKAPTANSTGRYGYSCEKCNMTFTEIIPKTEKENAA